MDWRRHYFTWVGLLLALAALSVYALQTTTLNHQNHQSSEFSPDAKATEIHLISTNEAGTIKYTIDAQQLTHYTQRNHSLFSNPVITVAEKPDQPEWRITADIGEAFGGTDEVILSGHVNAKQAATVISTDHITVNQQRDTAETDAHVTIVTPESFLEADGMRTLLHAKHVTLLHHVRGLHVPKTIS